MSASSIAQPEPAAIAERVRTMTALIASAHLANDAFTSMVPALLPALGQRFGLDGAALALLITAFALSASLPQPLLGSVADRFGARVVGTLGLVATAAFVSLVGRADSVPLLVGLLLAGGFGSAALHPAGVGMARHLGGPHRGFGLAVFSASGMLGAALGPVVALTVAAQFGIAATAWMMVPGVLVAGLLYLFGPRHAPAAPPAIRVATLRLFDRTLARGPVGVLTLAEILASLAFLTFTSAVPLWLVNVQGIAADSEIIGWTLSTFAAAAAAGGLVTGALSKHLSRTVLVVGSLLLSLIALQGVLFATPGGVTYFALVALAGALLFGHTPLLVLTAQELSPGRESAASGLVFGVTAAAASLLYAVVGHLPAMVGLTATLAIMFAGVAPAAFIAGSVLRGHRWDTVPDGRAVLAAAHCLAGGCGDTMQCTRATSSACACGLPQVTSTASFPTSRASNAAGGRAGISSSSATWRRRPSRSGDYGCVCPTERTLGIGRMNVDPLPREQT